MKRGQNMLFGNGERLILWINAIADGGTVTDKPVTSTEFFLDAILKGGTVVPFPQTRTEQILNRRVSGEAVEIDSRFVAHEELFWMAFAGYNVDLPAPQTEVEAALLRAVNKEREASRE